MTQSTFARDRMLQSLSTSRITNNAAQARVSLSEELVQFGSSADGLSQAEAAVRLGNTDRTNSRPSAAAMALRELIQLFLNPLVIVLLAAAILSAAVGEAVNAIIIVVIVGLNVVLNFSQLYRSQQALDSLRRRVATSAICLRDRAAIGIPHSEVVPGDVALLRAGDVVPSGRPPA